MRWQLGSLVLFTAFVVFFVTRSGHDLAPGTIRGPGRPPAVETARILAQSTAANALASEPLDKQILFGDLHVHTTYSIDAFLYALPIFSEEGGHPPADACDHARYCAALDFFSINDHAEGLTPERWQATIDTLRECDARAGDAGNPDVIPMLGWEWTQVGATPETHYGHKNVVLRGLADDEITARPIAYRPASDMGRAPQTWQLAAGEKVAGLIGPDYADFMWWLGRLLAMPACAPDIASPDLAPDCLESADTPADLFRKLDEWQLDSLVIPHGLAWGIHAPPGARLDNQLQGELHDPARQRLLEVFSGHGNSEEYRAYQDAQTTVADAALCPAPTPDHLACCWQAGEIMRARCGDLPADECEARVQMARAYALGAAQAPHFVFPDTHADDWLDCDECRDCFKPAATLRAGETAQYALATAQFPPDETPRRFRFGFIASSDNHRARPATGYKQVLRSRNTDARGLRSANVDALVRKLSAGGDLDPAMPQEIDFNPRSFKALFDKERQGSFMYPGGLVAAHSRGRSRDALWRALMDREVYGTSGPRILLWFDLLNGPSGRAPMGSEVPLAPAPLFEVRALGSFEQKPGCPAHAVAGLGEAELERLCMGECYNPGDRRVPIEAIEVIRVRAAARPDEPVWPRIEDPWRRFTCPADGHGCRIQFSDPDWPGAAAAGAPGYAYYVRALQTPTPAINGANVRAVFDAAGNAVSTSPCYGDFKTDDADDCLAPVAERAWSSPIYVDRP